MRHGRITRALALLLVIAMVVVCVLLAQPVHGARCRLEGKPEPWEPDLEDVAYISRTIWGEARGCCREEQEAVAWCILERVDSPQFPDTISGVVLQPYQWQGYSPSNPAEPFAEMARDILKRWHNGECGIPDGMFWCSGDGVHQRFRDSYVITESTNFYPE